MGVSKTDVLVNRFKSGIKEKKTVHLGLHGLAENFIHLYTLLIFPSNSEVVML